MTLNVGARLGPYEVVGAIGAGGMGEVYRARDTKLKREVAIKVLPEAFASDAQRLARFQREAEVLAALNHPNIAAIYGLEESGGTAALILEFVEGETLAERIALAGSRLPASGSGRLQASGSGLPVDEALAIAKQIADALEAAHDKGVVHRDLKPANVKLRDDGTVKVLDFGLAKLNDPHDPDGATVPSALTHSPTLSLAATQAGLILGTAAYMSPEQAKGRPTDKRTDIWAFGCVLYEMLTGRPVFQAEDVSTILARVLDREPDFSALPDALHPRLRELLDRCLQKDPKRRYHDIADVRLDLEHAFTDPAGLLMARGTGETGPRRRPYLAWIAAGVGLALATAAWSTRPAGLEPEVVRLSYVLPADQAFTQTTRPHVAVSPDGQQIAYVANERLYLKLLSETESRAIEGAGKDPSTPVFSPDGEWIAYWSDEAQELRKISVSGGLPVPLTAAVNLYGASWGAGDLIVYGQPDGIWQVPAAGGTAVRILEAGTNETISHPQILPGGNWVLFTVQDRVGLAAREAGPAVFIAVAPLSDGESAPERKDLRTRAFGAHYLGTGHLLFVSQDGTLNAVAFDARQATLVGEAVPVLSQVRSTFSVITNPTPANYAVSDNGTLIYLSGLGGALATSAIGSPVIVNRTGDVVEALPNVQAQLEFGIRFSPDGNRLVMTQPGRGLIVEVDSGAETEFPFPAGGFLVWFGDRDIVWGGTTGIRRVSLDEQGEPEVVFEGRNMLIVTDTTEDGALLFHEVNETGADSDIWMLRAREASASPVEVVRAPSRDRAARFSPDGRWVAYVSDESGDDQVYVRPVGEQGSGARSYRVSQAGGLAPVWAPSGDELFYFAPNGSLTAVSIRTDPTFQRGVSRELFPVRGRFHWGATAFFAAPYDVHPKGDRFVFFEDPTDAAVPAREEIQVVLNWTEELNARVSAR